MSVKASDLKPGDVMCVGGQIGEFVGLFGKRKEICYRPFGGGSTRVRDVRLGVLVERNQRWVQVTK